MGTGFNRTLAEGLDVFTSIVGSGYRPLTVERLGEMHGHSGAKLRRILRTLESRGLVMELHGGWVISDAHLGQMASAAVGIGAQLAAYRERSEVVTVLKEAAITSAPRPFSEGPTQDS